MKKVLLSVLAFAAMATSEVKADIFNWGITAGMNTTKPEFHGGHLTSWEPDAQTGWYAGLQFRFAAPAVGIGADFGIVFTEETVDCTGVGTLDKEVVDFISIPVHLRYELRLPLLNDILTPYVMTGPQVSYNVEKLDKDFRDEDFSVEDYSIEKFDTQNLVCHWDLGGGLLLFERLQVGYHYSFPITNMSEMKAMEKAQEIQSNFKLGTHHLDFTIFF